MSTISVIVPIYNVGQYLEKCIDSILGQIFTDFELLLVDDGSTDDSGRICDRYAEADGRIRVIHQDNQGLAAVRKNGVKAAEGDYIAFVDGDDWVEPDFLSFMYDKVAEGKRSNVIMDMITSIYVCEEEIPRTATSAAEDGVYDREGIIRDILPSMVWDYRKDDRGILASLCVKLLRKELLLEVMNEMDTSITIGEDGAITYPLLLKAQNIEVTHHVAYHYMMRDSSILHRLGVDKFDETRRLHEYLNRIFDKAGLRIQLQDQIDQYTWSCVKQIVWGVYDFFPDLMLKPYSFNKLPYGSRIVLYGAGKVGKRAFQQIAYGRCAEVVAWVDKNAENVLAQMRVEKPETIADKEYDYVLIAVNSKDMADQIKSELLSLGVDEGKILWKPPGR